MSSPARVRLRRKLGSPVSLLVAVDAPAEGVTWPELGDQYSQLIGHVFTCEAEATTIDRLNRRVAGWEREAERERTKRMRRFGSDPEAR